MPTLVSRRSQRNIPREGYKLANLLYATNWAGLSVDSPTLVGGANPVRYPNAATSLSSVTIVNSGIVTLTLAVDTAFVPGDSYIRVEDAADANNYMEGDVTEYNTVPGSKILKFNVQHSGGSGTKSNWKVGGTIPVGRNYTCSLKFSGADAETGFALPTGAPFYATENTGFGIQDINWMDGYPSNDAAGVSTSVGTTFESAVINGKATTAFVLEQKQPVAKLDSIVGYKKQSWGLIQRPVASSPDIPRLDTRYNLWLDDLVTKLSVSNRRLNFWEMKTGTDFRYTIGVIKASAADAADPTNGGVLEGAIGWELVIDNKANALPYAPEFLRWKNYIDPVPLQAFFPVSVYFQRSVDYNDLITGRFLFRMKPAGSSESAPWTTIFDVNAATVAAYNATWGTSYVNRHKGIHSDTVTYPVVDYPDYPNNTKVGRIFWFGLYGKYEWINMIAKCANLEFRDGFID